MCSIGNLYDGPWLCIGDFNMIMNQSDKKGGRPFACSSNDPFQSFVHSQGLVDLGFSGNSYTWSNNRDSIHLIQERLDRGLASAQWSHLFHPFPYVTCHLTLLIIILSFSIQLPKPLPYHARLDLRNFGLRILLVEPLYPWLGTLSLMAPLVLFFPINLREPNMLLNFGISITLDISKKKNRRYFIHSRFSSTVFLLLSSDF
ncbi:hypothetical protein SLA2020_400710 [Shorea laevis]